MSEQNRHSHESFSNRVRRFGRLIIEGWASIGEGTYSSLAEAWAAVPRFMQEPLVVIPELEEPGAMLRAIADGSAEERQTYPDFEAAKAGWRWWQNDPDANMKIVGSPHDANVRMLMRDHGLDEQIASHVSEVALRDVNSEAIRERQGE